MLFRPAVPPQPSSPLTPRCIMSADIARASATAFVLAALAASPAPAGQVPGPAAARDVPVSARDRVYAAEQFSNTVSVIDPMANKLLGVIRLGEPQPSN